MRRYASTALFKIKPCWSRWGSAGTADGKFWEWNSPRKKANPLGKTSRLAPRNGDCVALSWSAMIIAAFTTQSPPYRRKRYASDAYVGLPMMTSEELPDFPGLEAVMVETDGKDLLPFAMRSAEKGLHISMDNPGGEDLAGFRRLLDLGAAENGNRKCAPARDYTQSDRRNAFHCRSHRKGTDGRNR